MDRPTVIIGLDVFVHGFEVAAEERFIAETPNNNRWMQLVSFHERLGSIHVCVSPIRVIGRPFSGFLSGKELAFAEGQITL
jgi:hypothetical protein